MMNLDEINKGLRLMQLAKEAWESRVSSILHGTEKELVKWAEIFLKQRTARDDDLLDQANKIHRLFNEISDALEVFLHNGGQFNLRIYHNEGCESIDLHQLNGEFECSFLQVKKLKLDVPGELDGEGNKRS